ncbi:phage tail protein [Lutibacter citreus]|uniref:phage tail protein n=1 Tax=Lutibacter citreus TaxID=2138210 RepID=UPI000DBE6B61|nr:phage tail protein [Lutibacter citreus]
MKSKLLLLSLLMLFTFTTNYAQTSASQAGIAVQGIARDNNNTAITTGDLIPFLFTIYYTDSNTEFTVFSDDPNLKTDAFGVFSYVLDVDPEKNSDFANFQMWLKIEAGSPLTEISNEPLKHVPYAISANNGVPTGSIMPYLGDSEPPGWVLCKGQTFASIGDKGNNLKEFLGGATNVPNLQGMFLRGTGISPENGLSGPALNAPQGEGFKEHDHDKGTLDTEEGGEHHHTYKDRWRQHMGDDNGDDQDQLDNDFRHRDSDRTTPNFDGAHNHTITGRTGDAGTTETRPVNHGVNYIIKL